jgi:tRNA(Ile)-lysidine synthase
VEKEFRKIIEQAEFAAGSRLLLAVSGGVDSVVLLDLLARNAAEFGLRPQVLHLDHSIRPESGADAEFVRNLCLKLDIPCRIETVDVPALAKERRLSLETAGREARREALSAWAEEHGCARILLAHHHDDQAETFLQRLLRGSGRSGLQGMSAEDGLWWRPLLGFSRQQILDYAAQRKLDWVEDASNSDTGFLRNRIRHRLLPKLRDYNPQITRRLTSLSRQFRVEEDYWQQMIASVWPGLLLSDRDGLRLSRQVLLGCHRAMQMRLLREGLRLVRGDLRGIESVHLEAVLELVLGERSQAELDLPGCWAARRYEQLWLRKRPPVSEEFELCLNVDEPLSLPDGRILLAELRDRPVEADRGLAVFDATRLQLPLRVRSPRTGDRFRPSGMEGQRKIKDFLIDLKLEKEERRSLPLLLNRQEILWLVGLRRSALAPVMVDSREVLVVRLLKGADSETKPL